MSGLLGGLYAVTVDDMIRTLTASYVSLITQRIPFEKFPSVMLWGPPGVGKSQGVRRLAENIEKKTKKQVVITDVRLLLFNPVDLRGIPTANEEKTLAIWLKPKIFQMDNSEEVVNILFLDEISAAPPSVQAAAYQITLDRTIGEHKLPANCIVIAAGNRVTDKSVAYNMPKALANRLCHFEIKGDSDAWHDWAIRKGIHEYVVGYLEFNSAMLMKFDSSGTEIAFATPRSWEMVSNILNTISDNMNDVYLMIIGCIGIETASGFREWTKLYEALPDMEDIFEGKDVQFPKEKEFYIALRTAMVAYARNHQQKGKIDNSIDYACKLPWGFRNKLLHDYYCIEEIRPILKENEVFRTALNEVQR